MMPKRLKYAKQTILGIDPGTRVTGYGVVSIDEKRQFSIIDYGCIRPPPSQPLTKRYSIIFHAIEEILQKFTPDAVAVENQFIHKDNPQSGLTLGMARGVITLAATLCEVPVFAYSPTRAKQSVTGNGRASKEQVQKMIQHLLQLNQPPSPQDAADALALAICHIHVARAGIESDFRI